MHLLCCGMVWCAAEKVARELLPIIQEQQSLRPGSYSNAMEEVSAARRQRQQHNNNAKCVLAVVAMLMQWLLGLLAASSRPYTCSHITF